MRPRVAGCGSRDRQTPSGTETTVRDGVYSEEQAKRGRATYDAKCASCHDGGHDGARTLGRSVPRRSGRTSTSATFFTRIQTTMPEDAPGSLSESDVLDIIAYVLQTNGFPAGDKAIARAREALATMKFVRQKVTALGGGGAEMTTVTRVVTLVLSLACFAHSAAAQTVTSTTGAINGTVTDSTKSMLPGVTVTLSGAGAHGHEHRGHRSERRRSGFRRWRSATTS